MLSIVTDVLRSRLFGVAAAATVCVAMAGVAKADRVNMIPFGDTSGVDASNTWVEVSESGSDWLFEFHHDASDGSSLTDIFFEIGYRQWDLLAGGGDNRTPLDSDGVLFGKRSQFFSHPTSAEDVDWAGNAFTFGSSTLANGVDDAAEALTIRIAKASNVLGISDLIDALLTNGARIAAVVQGSDGNASVITSGGFDEGPISQPEGPIENVEPVSGPLPAAVWPGLMLLGGLGLARRRRSEA